MNFILNMKLIGFRTYMYCTKVNSFFHKLFAHKIENFICKPERVHVRTIFFCLYKNMYYATLTKNQLLRRHYMYRRGSLNSKIGWEWKVKEENILGLLSHSVNTLFYFQNSKWVDIINQLCPFDSANVIWYIDILHCRNPLNYHSGVGGTSNLFHFSPADQEFRVTGVNTLSVCLSLSLSLSLSVSLFLSSFFEIDIICICVKMSMGRVGGLDKLIKDIVI